MPRASKDWQPAPSIRHCSDARRAEANAADAVRLAQVKEEEKQIALRHRNSEMAEIKRLEEELKEAKGPSLHGLSSKIGKLNRKGSAFYEHVQFGYDWLKRFDLQDIPPLIIAVLKKVGREKEQDLCWKTIMDTGMASARDALLNEHEKEISKHLTEKVYTDDHFALLRLVGGMSKRLCCLIEQALKYVHLPNGKKIKQRLHPRSSCTTDAPLIFSLRGIIFSEEKAAKASKLELQQHEDMQGADICGKAYALDQAMLQSIGNTSRAGGMATKGTKEDPHLMCISGDGAGLTEASTGVRVGHFPGSTNLLNQSSLDVVTWLFYKAQTKAEDYAVLNGRLINVLPDLRRLYAEGEPGELLLDGEPTGIYVEMVLVADKPFIRHICGLLSHNADAFGAPFCDCCDDTHRPALFDFSMCKRTHYGRTSFKDLCERAHVPLWEALGQKEPEFWEFRCPMCPDVVFGTDHGGAAALDDLDAELAGMVENKKMARLNTHAKSHRAQQLRRAPLIPFHHVTHDPMHAVHNEANALLDEAVHKHLMVESNDSEVKKTLATAQTLINTDWKNANLPKYIQFGKDNQGAHSHALNGPCFEAVWGRPSLIIRTIQHMGPVYELLESKNLTTKLTEQGLAAGVVPVAATGSTKASKKGESGGKAKKTGIKRKKPQKVRRVDFGSSSDEEEVRPPLSLELCRDKFGRFHVYSRP